MEARSSSSGGALDIVGAAFRLAGRHPVPMVAIALLVAFPIQLAAVLIVPNQGWPDGVVIPLVLCVMPYVGVELSAAVLAQGVAIASAGGAPVWWTSVALAACRADLLVILAAQAAMAYVMFFTFVGAVAVVVWWSVAPVVLVLEGFPPREAISRSFRLMHAGFANNTAALVGGWLVLYIPGLSAASAVLRSIGHSASDSTALAPLSFAYVPVTPLLAVIVVLRYLDRRVANESVSFQAV